MSDDNTMPVAPAPVVADTAPAHDVPMPVDDAGSMPVLEPVRTMPEDATEETKAYSPDAVAAKEDEGETEERFHGYPLVRYHPVHGKGEFKTPNHYHRAGGDEGDWRFKSAFDADRARTGAEAALTLMANQQQLLDAHRANASVVRHSVQAEESRKTGYPEPGLN